MPGRKFESGGYRYGFNGKEVDKDIYGNGNIYDYGFRIYNPRIGKFLSVDPLTKEYPELTPYQFASNTPIEAIDLDGLEATSSKQDGFWKSFGKSVLKGIGDIVIYAANNPNHAGYGNGTQPATGKPPTQADFKRYEINWKQQLNPTWQIQNFAENLVYGTTNFIGGIIDGDGARTAQAIPQLFSAVGSMYGVGNVAKIPKIPFLNRFAGLSQSRLNSVANALLKTSGDKPYIISAVTDMKTGKTYVGQNKGIKSLDDIHPVLRDKLPKETLEKWTSYNCAECDAFNQALKDGAKWKDLGDMHTMRHDKKQGKYVDVERCENCKVTFDDKKPTSEK